MKSILITAALAAAVSAIPLVSTIVVTELVVVDTKGHAFSTSTGPTVTATDGESDPIPSVTEWSGCTTGVDRHNSIYTMCSSYNWDPYGTRGGRKSSPTPTPSVTETSDPDGTLAAAGRPSTPTTASVTPTTTPVAQATAPVAKQPTPSNDLDVYAPLGDENYPDCINGPHWARGVLAHNNIHRANHSAPMLKWNGDLAWSAGQIANTCKWGHVNNVGRGAYPAGSYMNNIVTVGDGDWFNPGMFVSDAWYNGEMPAYIASSNNFDPSVANPPDFETWGHFSMMVWKDHTDIGCALVNCGPTGGRSGLFDKDSGNLLGTVQGYMVCNYGPPGNMGGEYAQQVLPPKGMPIVGWAHGNGDNRNNFTHDLPTS